MKIKRCKRGATLQDRFDRYVMPVTECGCWLWIGSLNKGGYGQINVAKQMINTHRISWELHRGQVPDGLYVLHTCDVRSCVNPDHLFLGTHVENMIDMKKKKRSQYGERNPHRKLSEADVIKIRTSPLNQYELAEKYNLTQSAISSIQLGICWKHLPGQIRTHRKRRTRRSDERKIA